MNTIEQSTIIKDISSKNILHENLSVPMLVEKVLSREEGVMSSTGAIRATTGKYTGRSPKDRFIVKDEVSEDLVDWGSINQPISEEAFEKLYNRTINHLGNEEEIFSFKGFAGADKKYQLPVQIVTEYAWHNLFARQLFIEPTQDELNTHNPGFTVLVAPNSQAVPEEDGTNSDTFIVISFKHKVVLIGGTEYAGEIKKSIFSVMNYLLPQKDVLSMHCSANVGKEGDVALFFGLSGTGKTTLSADPYRDLIGDDEHGWSPNGVFNIEGGCYAKTVDLSKEKEPEIYGAITYGTVLENVMLDVDTRVADYSDVLLTENTRAAYPIRNIENIVTPSIAGHPNTIIFLTADATGTLPPISKLSKEQAMYHFLSGYTSKLAGTERGVTEPEPTFSACFGAPFLPLAPAKYAEMLGDKIDQFNANVFLVNTGWTGGVYGVGKRMKLSYTRAMVHAALEGELDNVNTVQDEIFGLNIPEHVPGVPDEVLIPRNAWGNSDGYDNEAKKLATSFHENFKKFDEQANDDIKAAAPIYRP